MDRRQYLRHFTIILGGNGAAQIANLLSYPFLARLYSPSAFGVFAMFVAASAIPGALACGRFELAVPLAPRWGRFAIVWLCIALSAAVALMSLAGAGVYWSVTATTASPILAPLLGLAVFLTGVCSALSVFLLRENRYRAASASVVVRTGTAVAAQVALAFVAATAFSLILGFVLGLLAQAAVLASVIALNMKVARPRLRAMRAMFTRFRKQVAVDIPSSLIAAFSLNLLVFLLAILYDQRTVGFFSVGNRMAIIPLALFNTALSQVFFQKAAAARDSKGHFWEEMKFSLATSAVLSVVVLALILLFARPFIGIYLGPEWLPSADMLMLLAPMLALRSFAMSIATTVFVLRSAHWLLIHNVANVLVTLAAFAIGRVLELSALEFVALVSAMLAVEYALFAMFLVWAARRNQRSAVARSAGNGFDEDAGRARD